MDNITEINEHENIVSDSEQLSFSQFKKMGEEKFQNFIKSGITPETFLKQFSAVITYKLPPAFNAYYIDEKTCPYYWISDAIPLKRAESLFKIHGYLRSATTSYDEIKKYYEKWLKQTEIDKKKFFAISTLDIIERNTNNQNFLKYIMRAIINSYDESLYLPESSFIDIDKASKILDRSRLDNDSKKELYYIIDILRGFLSIKLNQFDNAQKFFSCSLESKEHGIAGLYQEARFESLNENKISAINNLTKIIQYDKHCLEYSIELYSLPLFDYFFKNAKLYYIFSFEEFSNFGPDLEYILSKLFCVNTYVLGHIQEQIDRIRRIELNDYIDDSIESKIEFFQSFIDEYRENKNGLILIAGKILAVKFDEIIKGILDSIDKSNMEKIESSLNIYKMQLKDLNDKFVKIKETADNDKEIIKNKTESDISETEKTFENKIKKTETDLSDLENNEKYKPGSVFNNAMLYNFVISLILFVIGGFGSAFLSEQKSTNMFGQIVTSGLQWGGISFVLGTFAALFSIGAASSDKHNKKNKLLKTIDKLKDGKEKEIARIKSEKENREKEIEDEYNAEVEKTDNNIKKLEDEKEGKFNELKEILEMKTNSTVEQLNSLILNYENS